VFVDTELLRSGAGESHRAGEYAHEAANHLARGSLSEQMFGDFAAGTLFHEAAGSAQSHHVRVLAGNKERLVAVGNSAHLAASGFTAMDERNASSVRAVRCTSVT
jgi:hypothetical protein